MKILEALNGYEKESAIIGFYRHLGAFCYR